MMIKNLLIILILLSNTVFASQKMTIQELIALASTFISEPIVLDKNIDNTIYIYSEKVLDENSINSILIEVLKMNDLQLIKYSNYYILSTIKKELSLNRIIKINYLNQIQIKKILDHFKQDFVYIDNKILFTSLNKQFLKIKEALKTFDIARTQKKLRLTVLETNINKLREFGVNYNLSDISSNILNVSVGNIRGSYSPTQSKSFGIDLKAMASNGITKIVTNPILTIRDKESTVFNITRTVPTVTSTQTIIDGKTQTVENIDYKSFGIKINVTPVINKTSNDLTLDISLQDILSNTDNKTETSDKLLKQKVIIEDNSLYLLSGFKKHLKVTSDNGVPLLKDIPYMGYFFKWESKENIEIMLQILIEIVEEDTKVISSYESTIEK